MLIIFEKGLPKKYENEVWKLVIAADCEFIPRLSSRETTTQRDLQTDNRNKAPYRAFGERGNEKPVKYFEGLKKQNTLLAIEDGKVLGFMSYISGYNVDNLEGGMPCNYVSTIIVAPESRGQGITKKMYEALFKRVEGRSIVTRTWSSNHSHICILRRLEFDLVYRIADDRGKGIDTVYFQRML